MSAGAGVCASHWCFVNSGRLLAGLAAREGCRAMYENPSLLKDGLLASSCREQAVTTLIPAMPSSIVSCRFRKDGATLRRGWQ